VTGGRRDPEEPASSGPAALESVRLDVWLDVACVFPTRSRAKAACEGGKVAVNGAGAKPHREIRPGDRLTITASEGRRRELVVRGVAERSIPRAQARLLYEDVTEHLGFLRSSDEYKVMAMASYGKPRYAEELTRCVHATGDGGFRTEPLDWASFAKPLGQGDAWDTQWDMFTALIGAITAQLILSKIHDKAINIRRSSIGSPGICARVSRR
jgi:ribosomal 50S subunit-recycling heat shock protein